MGGGPSIPAPPPPPDPAESFRENVFTELETQPLRRGQEIAQSLGYFYDPETGRTFSPEEVAAAPRAAPTGVTASTQQASGFTNRDLLDTEIRRAKHILFPSGGTHQAGQLINKLEQGSELSGPERAVLDLVQPGLVDQFKSDPGGQFAFGGGGQGGSGGSIDGIPLDRLKSFGISDIEAQRLKALGLKETIKQVDPNAFAAREKLGEIINADLARGGALDPSVRREIQQAERGAQTARGVAFGTAPAAAEAFATGTRAEAMRQQGLANAQAFVFGAPLTNQFVPTQGATALSQGINAGAGPAGQQFALGVFGQQSGNFRTQAQLASQQSDPFLGALGSAFGFAGSLASGGLF